MRLLKGSVYGCVFMANLADLSETEGADCPVYMKTEQSDQIDCVASLMPCAVTQLHDSTGGYSCC